MLPDITLRLSICANDCPVGPRLERGVPLPPYRHTYALEEQPQAEADLELIRDYVQRNHLTNKKKK
jgi:hypothetical protein